MNLDMTAATGDGVNREPGVFLARVYSVEDGKTKGGDDKLSLKLVHDHGRKPICFDTLTISESAWWVSHPKLVALGIDENHKGEFDPQTLRDRRVWVAVKLGEWDGKKRLEVDIDQLTNKGYQPWQNTPAGQVDAQAEADTPPF